MDGAEPIKWAMKNEKEHNFEPEAPKTKDDKEQSLPMDTATAEGCKLKLELDQHHKNIQRHNINKTKAHGFIIGQRTQAMKNELEAREDWSTNEDNTMGTLKAIKEISCNHQSTEHHIGTLSEVIKDCFSIGQEENEPSIAFAKQHKTTQDLMEDRFGKIHMEEAIKTTAECQNLCGKGGDLLDTCANEAKELTEGACKRLQGCNCLCASNLDKAKQLCKSLNNDCAMGIDKCPEDLDHAIAMLN